MQLKLDNPVDATESPEGYRNLPVIPNKTSLEDVLFLWDLMKNILDDLRKKTETHLLKRKEVIFH